MSQWSSIKFSRAYFVNNTEQENIGDFFLTNLHRISSSIIQTDVLFDVMTFICHIGTNIAKELLPPSAG
jgi:hypothetical protein